MITSSLRLFVLTALVALPAAVEARPLRHAVKPPPNPALKARTAAMEGFSARMSRLDGLMGIAPRQRSRSASAE